MSEWESVQLTTVLSWPVNCDIVHVLSIYNINQSDMTYKVSKTLNNIKLERIL